MPILLLLALFVLWHVPLTLRAQRALFSLAEIVYAWATTDVITLSVVAAQLQIKQFVAFIVGNHCNAINVLVAQYADGVFGPGEDSCFDVEAFLDPGSWVLFSSAVLSTIACVIVTRSCDGALHERIQLGAPSVLRARAGEVGVAKRGAPEGAGGARLELKHVVARECAAAEEVIVHPLSAWESASAHLVGVLCWLCILRIES